MSGGEATGRTGRGGIDQLDGAAEVPEVAPEVAGEVASAETDEAGVSPEAEVAEVAEPEPAPVAEEERETAQLPEAEGAAPADLETAGPPEGGVAGPRTEPDLLAEVTVQRDEYLDGLRRLQAEFENFRKRMARQQQESFERATQVVVERLLPALDALDLALAHVGELGPASAETADGQPDEAGAGGDEPGAAVAVPASTGELEAALVKIANLLRDILAKEGLERIDTAGVAFDPNVHDAVAGGTGAGTGDGPAVVEVLRAGYRLRGRVLRPAMVKVSA